MGLNKRNSNVTYLNLKEGKIYESTDKEKTNPYDEVSGIITNFSFREDEFEGTKIRKFNIVLTDGETDYVLGMKVDSSYFSTVISFLKNANLSEEITLVPFYKKEKDGKISLGILVKQGGFLKHFYTKDNPNGLPAFNKVRINGKDVWDKTDYMAFLENVVNTELKPKLAKPANTGSKGLTKSADTIGEENQEMVSTDEIADDLPF